MMEQMNTEGFMSHLLIYNIDVFFKMTKFDLIGTCTGRLHKSHPNYLVYVIELAMLNAELLRWFKEAGFVGLGRVISYTMHTYTLTRLVIHDEMAIVS